MKSIKSIVSLSALVVCMGAASVASAGTVTTPVGASSAFSALGTITVTSPSSFGAPVDCNIEFNGTVGSGVASITSATVTGTNRLCGLPKMTGFPWVLSFPVTNDTTNGKVTNVGYTIAGIPPLIPATACGSSTINVVWGGNTARTITATGQALAGGCNVVSLVVTASSNVSVVNP